MNTKRRIIVYMSISIYTWIKVGINRWLIAQKYHIYTNTIEKQEREEQSNNNNDNNNLI